jgi:hypothetical protein
MNWILEEEHPATDVVEFVIYNLQKQAATGEFKGASKADIADQCVSLSYDTIRTACGHLVSRGRITVKQVPNPRRLGPKNTTVYFLDPKSVPKLVNS